MRVGMFLFNRGYDDSASLAHSVKAEETGNVLFTFELPRGTFEYSLEGLAADSRVAARNRGTITAVPVPRVGLATSDLVLAGGVVPRVDRPGGWRDFAIGASRDLVFDADEDIHVYLEVYGLTTDFTGSSEYTVEVTLQDAEQRGVGARLLRSLGSLIRGADGELAVRFVRTAEPVDGVVPEYFSVSAEEAGEGAHRLMIVITDRTTGASVRVERELSIRGPGGEPRLSPQSVDESARAPRAAECRAGKTSFGSPGAARGGVPWLACGQPPAHQPVQGCRTHLQASGRVGRFPCMRMPTR